MAGEDPLDPVTQGSEREGAARALYLQYLKSDALTGQALRRTGLHPAGHRRFLSAARPAVVPEVAAAKQAADQAVALDPRTRAAFMKALEELRAARRHGRHG
jgi:amidase